MPQPAPSPTLTRDREKFDEAHPCTFSSEPPVFNYVDACQSPACRTYLRRSTCAALYAYQPRVCRTYRVPWHHRSSRTASRFTAGPGSCRWGRRCVAAKVAIRAYASASASASAPAPAPAAAAATDSTRSLALPLALALDLTFALTDAHPPQTHPTPRAGVRRLVPRDDHRQGDGHRRRYRDGGGEDDANPNPNPNS